MKLKGLLPLKKINTGFIKNLILMLTVFSLPLLFTLRYVLYSSGNIIYADDFNFISFIRKYFEGNLTFFDLWAPYNGMRLIIGKIITILSVKFTGWNVQILMCISLLVIMGTAILIYLYYRENIIFKNRFYHFIAFLPVVLLLFSIRQWESLLFGAQLPLFMALFFVVLSMLLMQKSSDKIAIDKYLLFSIVTSTLATFSFESALLVWPLLITQILLSGFNKNNFRKSFVYLVSAIIVLAAYFYNNDAASHFSYFVTHLGRATGFVLVNIGNSIIGEFTNKPIVCRS